MISIRPSYAQGYANSINEAKYPCLWTGLVALWSTRLGPTGGVLRDIGPYKNDGALTNMDIGPDWELDTDGYALDFDGSNDYISMESRESLNVGAGSVSVIARMKTNGTLSGDAAIYNYGRNGVNPIRNMFLPGGSGKLRFAIEDNSTNQVVSVDDTGVVDDSAWHVLCVVVDRSSQLARRYIDGLPSGTDADISSVGNTDSSDKSLIGHGKSSGGGVDNSKFPGKISEVIIYNRILLPREILQLSDNMQSILELKRTFVGMSVPAAGGTDILQQITPAYIGVNA